jgi:hypothetical protein
MAAEVEVFADGGSRLLSGSMSQRTTPRRPASVRPSGLKAIADTAD